VLWRQINYFNNGVRAVPHVVAGGRGSNITCSSHHVVRVLPRRLGSQRILTPRSPACSLLLAVVRSLALPSTFRRCEIGIGSLAPFRCPRRAAVPPHRRRCGLLSPGGYAD
jgi:hypothetical protein